MKSSKARLILGIVICLVQLCFWCGLCVFFVDHCLSFCRFIFWACIACSPSIYGFWLSLWYRQTVLSVFGFYSTVTSSYYNN